MSTQLKSKELAAQRHAEISKEVGTGQYIQFGPGGKVYVNGNFSPSGLRMIADALEEITAVLQTEKSQSAAAASAVLKGANTP